MNFKDLRQRYITEIASLYTTEEALAMYYITVKHLYGWNKSQVILHLNDELEDSKEIQLKHILTDLNTGKPLQYILGETQFYGLPFKVTEATLIPRPETEELVHWILSDQELKTALPQPNILDIGTGTGCIAISIKKNLPHAIVKALDISKEAITVAKDNSHLNEVEVSFIHADILSYSEQSKYHLIVSNPPYIKNDEKADMHPNVLKYEPHGALFVENDHPLLFYKAIADFARKNLFPAGLLYFEINEYLGKETIEMLKDKGFTTIELRKDMQGKERMICCSIPVKTEGEIE
ncbi:peptide chain release factor N(5)-glutamine methyltransferase [Pedobacter sp. MC2016-14]|uniref:peptide chain release factor N(5)-glutamine methyltransferase n=1 Tax=Pedobacter sp. MC2016-14 TaxID=2897327 RepID=UPI001E4A1E3E|nr:peptide chain release factor N(5)-glutamine methyltransferase [Pedobacter sp. MC2016-14]MCD0490001.1 peptide chain release factor N(5)-glutamine methyltransferase [Pedobacter sp. MC2016-14]